MQQGVHVGVNMEGRRMRDLESIYLVMMIFLCGLRKISLRSVWRSNWNTAEASYDL